MLQGRRALVTGASRGIGQAIATDLASRGVHVIGTATSTAGAEAIEAHFAANKLSGQGVVANVDDSSAIEALIASLLEKGPIEILVHNAGITRDNLSMRMKDADWDAVIETNLSAVFRLSRLVMRPMMKQRYGRIVHVTSVVGHLGNAGQANYAAAKAGVEGMSRSLARELGSRGITVNCVAPGFIDTDMTRSLGDSVTTGLLAQIPLGRLGRAAEVAHAVGFLCEADYVTGATIHVNGGMHMA
ncbi:MAG: 3-oxoacyl-ACP reductase FabG [Betaproteobacteria bacterium]|nr:3-oxoacyl-ACP reductase FabG [Betaproteobacteria bacterium]